MAGIDNIRSGQTLTTTNRSAVRSDSSSEASRSDVSTKSPASKDAVSLSQQGKAVSKLRLLLLHEVPVGIRANDMNIKSKKHGQSTQANAKDHRHQSTHRRLPATPLHQNAPGVEISIRQPQPVIGLRESFASIDRKV